MATLIASAKLTNAFRIRVVDKNVSAAITTTATLAAVVRRTRRIVSDLESTSSLANTMRYATKGGKGVFAVTSSLVCEFPTYIEIDIEALMLQGLPEGTDCVLSFQEGWMLEDRGRQLPSGAFEYAANTQNAPSPEFPSFVTFRTPKFFRSAFSSVFSIPNTVSRRRPFSSSVSSISTLSSFAILNPGKFAALFGGVFLTTPTARKTARTGATLYNSFGPEDGVGGSVLATILKIKQLASVFPTGVATLTEASELFNTPGPVTMTNSFTMNVVAVKNTEINLVSAGFASMTTVAVKTTPVQSAMVLGNSLSIQTNYVIDSLIPTLALTSSLELVTDIRFIMQTNLNAVDYLGNTLTNTQTVGIPLGGLHNANTNITIFWGDGSSDTYANSSSVSALSSTNPQHTYAQHGEYDIRIKVNAGALRGLNPGINFPDTNWTNKIKHFVSFGYKNFSAPTTDLSLQRLFARIPYAQFKVSNELPIHTGTKNADWRFEQLFQDSKVNPTEIANWQIYGRFANLQSMFERATNFNQPFNNDFISNLTSGVDNYGGFITDASQFNNPLTFWKFPNSLYSSGGQFGLALNGTAMNSENWNRTLIALANALSLNTQSGFIATVSRPSSATTNSTVYGSGTYNTGTGARTYLISRGWTVG